MKKQQSIRKIQKFLEDYREDIGYYYLLAIPNAGHTLLRLNHIDAIIVTRSDYSEVPPELAEVCAWIRAARRRHPKGRPVPLALNPREQQQSDCAITVLATSQKSCFDQLTDCVERVTILCNQAQRGLEARQPYAGSEATAFKEIFVQALDAGWRTPDDEIGPTQSFDGTREDAVWDWIHRRPALACSSVADAMGWLAYEAAVKGTTPSESRNRRMLSDGEQIISCALAWAFEATNAARERYRALRAGVTSRVAIVWHGNNGLQFRLALRAMLLEPVGSDTIPERPASSWESALALSDLAQRSDKSSSQAADMDWVSPRLAVARDDIETELNNKAS